MAPTRLHSLAWVVLPWLGLAAGTLALDAGLHALGWDAVGRWLGPVGTALVVLSFGYSLQKRKHLRAGSPKRWLQLHEVLGWVGTLLVMVHAGVHVHALLPWAALVAMVVVVASGLTGSVLLKLAMAKLREHPGAPSVLDGVVVDTMKRWRAVHLPLNAVFVVLALWHVATVLLLGGW